MIVVDTSVWVAIRRRPAGEIANTLRTLLDEDEVALALPVRLSSDHTRAVTSNGLSG